MSHTSCKRNLKQLSFPRDVYYLHKPLRRNRWILPTGNCKPARADLVLLVLFPAFAPLPRPDILHEGSRKLKIVYANSSWRAFLYSCHAHTCNHRMTALDWLNMVNAGLMRHGTWDIEIIPDFHNYSLIRWKSNCFHFPLRCNDFHSIEERRTGGGWAGEDLYDGGEREQKLERKSFVVYFFLIIQSKKSWPAKFFWLHLTSTEA